MVGVGWGDEDDKKGSRLSGSMMIMVKVRSISVRGPAYLGTRMALHCRLAPLPLLALLLLLLPLLFA
jgi:hypothetical protein